MAVPGIDAPTRVQISAILDVLETVVGDGLGGAYLHGSAVHGGLRPSSDIDVLAVLDERLSDSRRHAIVEGLMPISGSRALAGPARPVEVTLVVRGDIRPWHYPPMCELLYGEWEREAYEQGHVPQRQTSPDLAIMLSAALSRNTPIRGPSLDTYLNPVSPSDLRLASIAGVEGLLQDLADDTRNVILTFCRIWLTVVTGTIESKDVAAAWAMSQLAVEDRRLVARAREGYLGVIDDEWVDHDEQVQALVERLLAEISASARQSPLT